MNRTIVVARHKEDTGWLDSVHGLIPVVYDKSADVDEPWNWKLKNIGFEANTYLHWIVDSLSGNAPMPDEVVFCQGNPFDHDPDFLLHLQDESVRHYGPVLTCPPNGGPGMLDGMLDEYCRVFGLPVQSEYRFIAGAQFRVTRDQITAHPLAFYEALLAITKLDPRSPYKLERLWPLIFRIPL